MKYTFPEVHQALHRMCRSGTMLSLSHLPPSSLCSLVVLVGWHHQGQLGWMSYNCMQDYSKCGDDKVNKSPTGY